MRMTCFCALRVSVDFSGAGTAAPASVAASPAISTDILESHARVPVIQGQERATLERLFRTRSCPRLLARPRGPLLPGGRLQTHGPADPGGRNAVSSRWSCGRLG
jgi:hypothetical protein